MREGRREREGRKGGRGELDWMAGWQGFERRREGGREGTYLEGALGGDGVLVLEHDVHEALQLLVHLMDRVNK